MTLRVEQFGSAVVKVLVAAGLQPATDRQLISREGRSRERDCAIRGEDTHSASSNVFVAATRKVVLDRLDQLDCHCLKFGHQRSKLGEARARDGQQKHESAHRRGDCESHFNVHRIAGARVGVEAGSELTQATPSHARLHERDQPARSADTGVQPYLEVL
eukprot:COSAG02_NODE_8358_length_2599_cov_2.253600_2_plen_160_part_00